MALHNYHSAYKELPEHMGGTTNAQVTGLAGGLLVPGHNRLELSALVGMTPFMEQQGLWEQISNPYLSPGQTQQETATVRWSADPVHQTISNPDR